MIKIAEYMQEIITDLPLRLNIIWKVSDKTHQGRARAEPNHAHADKSQRRSLSLWQTNFQKPAELQSPTGEMGFVCITTARQSVERAPKVLGISILGEQGLTPAWGSSHRAVRAHWLWLCCTKSPAALSLHERSSSDCKALIGILWLLK